MPEDILFVEYRNYLSIQGIYGASQRFCSLMYSRKKHMFINVQNHVQKNFGANNVLYINERIKITLFICVHFSAGSYAYQPLIPFLPGKKATFCLTAWILPYSVTRQLIIRQEMVWRLILLSSKWLPRHLFCWKHTPASIRKQHTHTPGYIFR